MHNVARKLRVKDGGSSMAVSKDSLYTVQDGVGVPRIAAAPAQARAGRGRGQAGGRALVLGWGRGRPAPGLT